MNNFCVEDLDYIRICEDYFALERMSRKLLIYCLFFN